MANGVARDARARSGAQAAPDDNRRFRIATIASDQCRPPPENWTAIARLGRVGVRCRSHGGAPPPRRPRRRGRHPPRPRLARRAPRARRAAPRACACSPTRCSSTTAAGRGDEVRTAMLRLDFDYGGRRVRVGDPRPLPRASPGPDRDAEAQACRVLESFGAIELAQLDDCAVAPGCGRRLHRRDRRRRPRAVRVRRVRGAAAARTSAGAIEIDPDVPVADVGNDAPLYAAAEPDDKRPDWFGLELGVEIDGQRIDLLPALLDLLDSAGDLATLVRPARRCVAVRVDDKRWLPVPPARLRMLAKVLLELYRDGDKLRGAGDARAADRRAVRDAARRRRARCAGSATPGSAIRRTRSRSGRAGRRRPRRRPSCAPSCGRTSATASRGSSTCARTTPAACSPTTWASARRCRRSRTS